MSTQLSFSLALSTCTFTKEMGTVLPAISIIKNHFSWATMGFNHDAGIIFCTFDPCHCGWPQARTRSLSFSNSKPVGSPGSSIQCYINWPTEQDSILVLAQGVASFEPPILRVSHIGSHSQGMLPSLFLTFMGWEAVLNGHPACGYWKDNHLSW